MTDADLFQKIFNELRLMKTELRLSRVKDEINVQDLELAPDLSEITALVKGAEVNIYHQLESLTGLYHTLNVRHPLPPMRGWAISPDFASLLVKEILMRKPTVIVELGSGVSTIVCAYTLRKLKQGRVFSFDHDMKFSAATLENINMHELDDIAHVQHSPIGEVMVGNNSIPWYSISEESIPNKIDMLVIDGPPARTSPHARYPALPVLFDRLAEDAVVIMDDGIRQDEKEICKRWLEEYPEFISEYIETEKGAFILRRSE